MLLKAVKKKFIQELTGLGIILTIGTVLVFHFFFPERYFQWFPLIPVFFYAFGLFYIYMFEFSLQLGADKIAMTYLICKVLKFILSALVLIFYGFVIEKEVVAFVATFVFFYFAFLVFETRFFLRSETGGEGEIDVNELIFGHIGDAYEWHVVSFGDTHLTIHLPVIVKSSTGWHVFCSSHLEGGEEYEGLYIAEGGANDGKIVERNAAGEEVRPFDISITKNVLGLFINSAILLIVMLGCARWYKKHPLEQGAPKGGVGMIEATVMSIYDDVIKGCVGEDYRRYAPYLLTAFFFVLVNNLMGLIPIFPGGATVTGNIAITMVLALCTFLFTNIFGTKAYWKEIFWPEVPTWLKVPIPMMPLIEFFGIFTKPFALMIRLFANMMAGHAALLSLIAIIFITVKAGAVINGSMTVVAVAFGIFMNALELLVAFIQAYVFTMLSAVFIGLSRVKEHAEK